jgi:hypothetical protein
MALTCMCIWHYISTVRILVNCVVFGGMKFYIPSARSNEMLRLFSHLAEMSE